MPAHAGTHSASDSHRFSEPSIHAGFGGVEAGASSGGDPRPGLIRYLLLLGFTGREARLYLELLRGGPQGARELTEHAGLQRATAYRVLLRLLSRGVIVGDGRSPQKFQALAIEIITRRLGSLLQEEGELNEMIAETCALASRPHGLGHPGSNGGMSPETEVRLLVPEGTATHPVLVEVAEAKESIDVILRPLATTPTYRSALTRTLSRAVRQGVRVKLLVDATPSDRRFVDRLFRESPEDSGRLTVRHTTPLAVHSYLVDGRNALRFPVLGTLGRNADLAVASHSPAWVRAQRSRFEALWGAAVAAPRRRPSTRSFGWRMSPEPTNEHLYRPPSVATLPAPRGVTPEEFRAGFRTARSGH